MRIRQLKIVRWRCFENIELALHENASLVCLVGANGTGKTHLLELIASCAHRLGLAPGIEIPRGDPFNDPHCFSLQFYLAQGVSDAIDHRLAEKPGYADWDRTLTVDSRRESNASNETSVEAGGLATMEERRRFASFVVESLRHSSDVHFLSLDADRAYPKRNIDVSALGQALDINWELPEYTRGRAFKASTTLYDEWIKYFLAVENQSATRLTKSIRKARQTNASEPSFVDPFLDYKNALCTVLPHLTFAGVDVNRRTLLFDTTGMELSFNELSGGEREIAFLIGQIDRFGLRQGLFMLDEPELHLNADLIRTWVGYLTGTMENGQIWLATHSLEAVEAAGQESTFVLERNDASKKVDTVARLDERPILSALSRAVGTPAFSISKLRFVWIEGEVGVGERERFRRLAGEPSNVRFLESGSCQEVVRRLASIKAIAHEASVPVHVGGVVDRDFQTDSEAQGVNGTRDVFVLPVHEVENYFLHPTTIDSLLAQNGRSDRRSLDVIRDAADRRAGRWVVQYTMATRNAKSLPDLASPAKEMVNSIKWLDVANESGMVIENVVSLSGYDSDDQRKFKELLEVGLKAYGRVRDDEALWKKCEGKQCIADVARQVGFADAPALMQAAFALWVRDEAQVSEELREFRRYVTSL